MNGVQRFLHNGNNYIRTAVDLSGPVRDIEDAVIQKPVARQGSLTAEISGTFTGTEETTYEIEVVDETADTPLVTAPVFSGVGNGEMSAIDATGLSPRTIEVTLADLGALLTAASADLQGVRVIMKTPGAAGNDFSLRINRTGLVFTPQSFSLLNELPEGTSTIEGPEFDWQTVTANPDGTVPATAKRIAFGEDRNNIYVQYKKQASGKSTYVFEPPTVQKYAEKTQIYFVTGSYTVELYEDGVDLRETYAGVVTLYDLLNAIKSTSTYLLVQGAVANDRTSNGQALLELALNTDARFIFNDGQGSFWATGFKDVSVSENAPTELIEATCIAATSQDSPGASLGNELWELRGSVTGLLSSNMRSGQLFSNAFFAVRIPQKLPEGYVATPQGSFQVKEVIYNDSRRAGNEEEGTLEPPHPGICVDSMTLGVAARDAVVTATYKKRPPDDNCSCKQDKGIALNPDCLGVITESEGGAGMPYTAPTIARLVLLYDWFADTVRENSNYFTQNPGAAAGHVVVRQDPFISQPGPSLLQQDPTLQPEASLRPNTAYTSLFGMVGEFEQTLAEVDKLPAGSLRTAAEDAWDDAITEFQGDVDTYLSPTPWAPPSDPEVVPAFEALTAGNAVGVFYDGTTLKARKATADDHRIGFVDANVLLGDPATVKYSGVNPAVVQDTIWGSVNPVPVAYWRWYPSRAVAGKYVLDQGGTGGAGSFMTHGQLKYLSPTAGSMHESGAPLNNVDMNGMALLPDRYRSRLQHVLISGGISPLGKGDAGDGGGDGCWRDNGDEFFWEIRVGDETYAPAFTQIPYYSAKRYPGGVVVNGTTTPSEGYYSTKEFGFIIDVPCPDNLVVGDQVVMTIGAAGAPQTYIKGDKLRLGLIAAQDVTFFGGNDGDNVQTWHVVDSVFGSRDPYLLDTDLPVAYSDAGIEFLISQGVIAFAKGDKFTFAIEGGNFRWRSIVAGVAGAWSADLDIVLTPIVLDSGLSLQFALGAPQAIFDGDLYRFVALQPYALSNVIKPDFDQWEWGASPAVAVFELDDEYDDIEAVGIGYHNIPEGVTVEIEGSLDGATYNWSETITWAADVIGKLFDAQTARYIRVTLTGAAGVGGIGWLYIGPAQKFTYSAQVKINREYKIKRSDGVNPNSLYKGRGIGGDIQWPEGHLTEADYTPMKEMLDWLKSNDDEALIFFPQHTRQTEVVLATVESDDIAFNDVYNFQPDVDFTRRFSCTIPLRGVAFR
jgi:hypothetical protein